MLATLLASLLSGRQGSDLVNSFETFDEIHQVSVANAQVATVADHATDGKQALRVTFMPAEWPHMMVTPAAPWDWGGVGGIALDVTNPGDKPVSFGVRLDDDPRADGWLHSRTAYGTIPAAQAKRFTIAFGPDPNTLGMRGIPPLADSNSLPAVGGGAFDAHHVVNFQVFIHQVTSPITLDLDNVRTVPAVSLKGIVDEFGQYSRADWPGKVHESADFAVRAKGELAEIERAPVCPTATDLEDGHLAP